MKKVISLLTVCLLMYACNGKPSTPDQKTQSEEDKIEKTESKAEKKVENDLCKAFLDEFAEWTDKFIAVAKKISKDQRNQEYMQEYLSLAKELGKWSSEWEALEECAQNPKHKARFEEIANKMNTELKNIGN